MRINYSSSQEKNVISQLLPYQAYDPESQLFHNKKSSGFLLEIAPLVGSDEESIGFINNLLCDVVPSAVDCQVLLVASNKISSILDYYYQSHCGQGEIFEWLAKKRIDYFEQGANQSLFKSYPYVIRNFRVILVFSKTHCRGLEEELLLLREGVVAALKSLNRRAKIYHADDLLQLAEEILLPSPEIQQHSKQWDPYQLLNQQITDPSCLLTVETEHLCLERDNQNYVMRAFVVDDFPKHCSQQQMNNSIGKLFNQLRQIPTPFIISCHLKLQDQRKSQQKAQMNFLSKDRDANSPLQKLNPGLVKQRDEWRIVRDRINDGDRLGEVFFQVLLLSAEDQIEQMERYLLDLYFSNGWRLSRNRYMQLQSYLSLCPMMISEGLAEDMKLLGLWKTMTAFNIANIIPLQGEWKGSASPMMLLPGRRGQLATWSPFDNNSGNYNMAIAAKSGSGKSVFTQEYIVSLLSQGGRAWVIDAGRSYEKTCRLLGGHFIDFAPGKIMSLNPFTMLEDIQQGIPLLLPLLAGMARPSGRIADEELRQLEKSLISAWGEKKQELSIDDLVNTLQQRGYHNLGDLLFPYTSQGSFGGYFSGPCTFDFKESFIVLELDDLKNRKDLRRIILMLLMYHVSQIMYLGDRNQLKTCIIDEAWDLLGGEEQAAKFIEAGYRTARRYRGNFVTVTQSINDYFKNSMSLAAYESSDIKVILMQSGESIADIKNKQRMPMDDFTEKLYKSLQIIQGCYSECVIRSPDGETVHRLILDPYSRILYSSKGEEFSAVRTLEKQGFSLTKAIEQVATRFYDVGVK